MSHPAVEHPTTKARRQGQKLRQAMTAQAKLDAAEKAANAAALKRDAAVLAAQEAGNTYADLTDALALSSARVTQILRRERHRATTA